MISTESVGDFRKLARNERFLTDSIALLEELWIPRYKRQRDEWGIESAKKYLDEFKSCLAFVRPDSH